MDKELQLALDKDDYRDEKEVKNLLSEALRLSESLVEVVKRLSVRC